MDTAALRDFAFKKLQEARERGSELAAVTAARAASSISGSVPVSSSFAFRSQGAAAQQEQEPELPVPLDQKLQSLKTSNDSLRAVLTGSSSGALDESIYKLDLINESLAFTIENIQEGSHVMKLLNRQLKDSAAMQNPAHKGFYQRSEQ
ncbi:hypothetical protein PRIC1_007730 [Phytophthora ramorum]|uniref:Uncharacterized protein n=1 Tax=Phytophthora ramorum TaxID=164328 RepID=H3GTF7_PHYRM|nr:hypothetical protein KRP23_2108 [Phytophthora ramorum]KAH7502577.1 hypothetical protein KRP22_8040 [Phytophthora ramorum]